MGRYYEAALDTSAAAGFKELTDSPVLWTNLKPEQKALIHLLLGQIDLNIGQNLIQALQALESLVDSPGLPGGLDGWKALTRKMNESGLPYQS
ncbi:hypothetical protein SAMN05216302_100888 [Nitrosomonas aestuarii]|uniref:Uncharacterized protein n=1 Tax=Nitrosomonas aestuarii TaxID=52441 RepID=A0A1I4AAB4_9PROT|nr:hypothetical protein [Nitrosomonas aestuarii]SFK53027.1 hypothetical protein SAMN05216302_100888 [Nitrosomonas aestuarii]